MRPTPLALCLFSLIVLRSSSGLLVSPPSIASPRSGGLHFLILPGFGNDASDYVVGLPRRTKDAAAEAIGDAASTAGSAPLLTNLRNRGLSASVVPISRTDWIQVFTRGIFDVEFWKGDANACRPAFRWYLEAVSSEVRRLRADGGPDAPKIFLVGHSAGGWLGRAALGYGDCSAHADTTDGTADAPVAGAETDDAAQVPVAAVAGIVTLGTPHLPPPPEVMDMTRGALRLTNELFPGAYHGREMAYVTVAGNAVRGKRRGEKGSMFGGKREPPSKEEFAYNSYGPVCGQGDVDGDGLVPVISAHLEGEGGVPAAGGGTEIRLDLDGVFHSVDNPDTWYGSEKVIDMWLDVVLEELEKRERKGGNENELVDSINGALQSLSSRFSSLF